LAREQVSIRRHEHRSASCVIIQSKWRVHWAIKQYKQAKYQVILIQAVARKNKAQRYFDCQRAAAVTISKCLRRYRCQMIYKRAVRGKLWCSLFLGIVHQYLLEFRLSCPVLICKGVVLCQSLLRQNSAKIELGRLRHESHMACATAIQACWRSAIAKAQFQRIKRNTVLLQSVYRRSAAERHFLKCKHSAIRITSLLKAYQCKLRYKRIIGGEIRLS
jgi:myosin heavy subunit